MTLMLELLKARVRPYYIYMADQVAGGEHFRTTVQKGLEIIQPKRYDGSETPDIVPIEIAPKKQRTAAKKASRPRRRKASGE